MLNICLFQVLAKFGDLGFPLLVQFYLGRCGSSSLVQTFSQLLNLSGKIGTLALSLGASQTFALKFLRITFEISKLG